jgi:hexosaminidase
MKRLLLAALLISAITKAQNTVHLIPAPAYIQVKQGSFRLSSTTVIVSTNADKSTINFFNNYLKNVYGFQLKVVQNAINNYISFVTPTFIHKPDNEERYTLNIANNKIQIQGDGQAGTFYGMQTLIQLLPTTLNLKSKTVNLPNCSIQDQPRFAYRGMHLDVSRHFFPISYIKKYIDYIALHKLNYFHWHLTDDQGWRIEIKKYPKLTSVGAWRDGTIIGRFPGTGNDGIKHGGFYTQEQVKEIVAYAAARHITVLPEIEMPGHSMAVLAAYPELSTTPDSTFKVPITWGLNGVVNNVFAPTEKTFSFLEDVLTEVMPLFPSEMIHIGGDECSKIWWHKDSATQQFMRSKNIPDEDHLQSYFIQRIEKFVNSKGKKIIGWDEILEGGLAPNAAVMSWTGEKGGIHAAKEKHQVVMTPGGWCYFDHSQTKNEDSVTIGGYTTLEKVYSYEPIPAELNAEEGKYVLGAQGNVWTEYMAYPSKIEYMIFPRMAALSEVLWSPKEQRNWKSFEERLPTQLKRYDLWKANYSKAYYEIQDSISQTSDGNGVLWNLKSKGKEIKYDTFSFKSDGWMATPLNPSTPYTKPILITKKTVGFASYKDGSNKITRLFHFNKATGKKVTVNPQPSPSYPGNGAFTLVDGIQNTKGRDRSSEFIGYAGNNVEITIDLGNQQEVSSLVLHFFESQPSWIYRPSKIEIASSVLGVSDVAWQTPANFQVSPSGNGTITIQNKVQARFIKLKVYNFGKIPEGRPGAGKGSWLFLDEVEVK